MYSENKGNLVNKMMINWTWRMGVEWWRQSRSQLILTWEERWVLVIPMIKNKEKKTERLSSTNNYFRGFVLNILNLMCVCDNQVDRSKSQLDPYNQCSVLSINENWRYWLQGIGHKYHKSSFRQNLYITYKKTGENQAFRKYMLRAQHRKRNIH